jgi:hypothetical protein
MVCSFYLFMSLESSGFMLCQLYLKITPHMFHVNYISPLLKWKHLGKNFRSLDQLISHRIRNGALIILKLSTRYNTHVIYCSFFQS